MKRLSLAFGLLALSGCSPRVPAESTNVTEAASASPMPSPIVEEPVRPDRQTILTVGRKLIGTTEATGKNDGPVIEAIQKAAGIGKGDPYCAAFNYWCYREADAAAYVPRSGWSPDWVSKPTWRQGNGRTPRPADAFGIWFSSKGRVAHTGLIEDWGESSAVTIEANTSPSAEFGAAGDRDGDGIWRKRRLIRQIYAVRDWIE